MNAKKLKMTGFLYLHSYRFTNERDFRFKAINTLKKRIDKNNEYQDKDD